MYLLIMTLCLFVYLACIDCASGAVVGQNWGVRVAPWRVSRVLLPQAPAWQALPASLPTLQLQQRAPAAPLTSSLPPPTPPLSPAAAVPAWAAALAVADKPFPRYQYTVGYPTNKLYRWDPTHSYGLLTHTHTEHTVIHVFSFTPFWVLKSCQQAHKLLSSTWLCCLLLDNFENWLL